MIAVCKANLLKLIFNQLLSIAVLNHPIFSQFVFGQLFHPPLVSEMQHFASEWSIEIAMMQKLPLHILTVTKY